MKIGFSTPARLSTVFFDEEFHTTNKWFKKHDPDKKINPVIITSVGGYFSFPTSGDDLIQKTPKMIKALLILYHQFQYLVNNLGG